MDRNLDWEGCFNARDLGGLRTVDGRETRWGAVVRSESLDLLTPAGWSALRAYGIRTIVDLRNDHELVGETPDQRPIIEEILARKQTSARALLLDLLEWLDAEAYVRSAGLGEADVAAVRSRLLAPVSTGAIERT